MIRIERVYQAEETFVEWVRRMDLTIEVRDFGNGRPASARYCARLAGVSEIRNGHAQTPEHGMGGTLPEAVAAAASKVAGRTLRRDRTAWMVQVPMHFLPDCFQEPAGYGEPVAPDPDWEREDGSREYDPEC